MNMEHEPSMNIPESSQENEQKFLDESLNIIPDDRKPEFLGYLQKYRLSEDEARKFRVYFLNGQIEEFLRNRQTGKPDTGESSQERAA